MSTEKPITFEAPSFAIFDVGQNAVRTTEWGNLAIFSTQRLAEVVVRQMRGRGQNVKVVPVWITPTEAQ